MSGSEDEAEFASADEGEPETSKQKPVAQKAVSDTQASGQVSSSSSSKDTQSPKSGEVQQSSRKTPTGKNTKKAKGGKGVNTKDSKKSPTTKGASSAVNKDTLVKEPSSEAPKNTKDSKKSPTKSSSSAANKETLVKEKQSSSEVNETVVEKEEDKSPEVAGEIQREDISSSTDKNLSKNSQSGKTDSDRDKNTAGSVKQELRDVVDTKIDSEMSDKETEEGRTPEKDKLDRETSANLIKSPSSQSIQRPEPDHTQGQENVLEKLADAAKPQGGWGWGWGSSLLNVASSSVSTFTKEVGEGIHTMVETVESTLSVPAPEKLAEGWEDDEENTTEAPVIEEPKHLPEPSQTEAEPSQNEAAGSDPSTEEKKSQSEEGGGWFSSWGVSNISNIVQKSGKTFVTGGLDVLETIGKKTFDVIKDHDPGLKKTKGLFFERGDKPNLSQMLKDAKEQREVQEKQEHENEEARKAHFGSLFDDFQGLAHLEALEMLSNTSEMKVSSLLNALPPEVISKVKPQLLEIKENFEINDEEEEEVEEQDFVKLVTDLFQSLSLGNTPAKLTLVEESIQTSLVELKQQLETDNKPEPKEIHRTAIKSLAELTAKSIEQFHKTGELMLIKTSDQTDLVQSSKHLASLTRVVCAEVGIVSTKFTECLNKYLTEENSSAVNPLVTNVYLEATNSSSYIQDGFQLLLPVLQQTALEKTQEPDS